MALNRSLILKWIFGLGLIVYLLTLIDFDQFFEVLSRAHLIFIFLAVLIVLFDRIWMAFKWKILLQAQGIEVSILECARSYFVASFIGLVLPTSVGSDLVRLFNLSVRSEEREKVAASIVVEKLLSMMAMLLLVIFCALLFILTSEVHQWKYFFIALGVFLGGGLLFILSLLYIPVERLQNAQGRFLKKIANVVLAYQQFKYYRKAMILFFVFSFFEQFMPFLFNYSLAKAFELPGTALGYFMVTPIIYLVARLPISVDGLGVVEGLFVVLFPLIGLNKTDAFLLGLTGRLVTTFSHLIGGVFYFLGKRK